MPDIKPSLRERFAQLLELPNPEAQQNFLEDIGRDDPGLRQELASLLQAHRSAGGFLDYLTPALPKTAALALSSVVPGTVIGPYTLLREIGDGGMGVVYLAEQSSPVEREVAIKIVKPGMDSKQVVARFAAERQALAMMSSPFIAKIIDGGTTTSERPFFVMEYVPGRSILRFCDDNLLTLAERLHLFLKVCEGVEHAHQKGVIHRDLKPGNILVEKQETRAVPKIIDFGIAKAVNQRLTQHTLHTRFDQLIGTPEYMSPEQARLSDRDIDTRSDIYSLGVILYEMLTGALPYNLDRNKKIGYDEVRDKIRNEEPSRPSETVESLDPETASSISQLRRSTPRELTGSMRRELDWIVLKALEKERDRRYESVGAFARDIERYLAGEPVRACPPSTGYRLRKFVSRHRVFLSAASIVLLTALAGMFASLRYAQQATNALKVVEEQSEKILDVNRSLKVERTQLQLERYAQDIQSADRFWKEGDIRSMTDVLDRYANPELGVNDPRGFEWWYLRGLATANGQILDERDEQGCLVRYSPDGKYLVVGWTDGQIDLRDAGSQELIMTFTGHGDFVNGCDFHPTEPILATIADDGTVRLWDLENKTEIRQFRVCEPGTHAHRVFFSADGSQLVSSADEDRVKFWETATGRQLDFIAGFSQGDNVGVKERLACSLDRARLVLGDRTSGIPKNRIYDFQTREKIGFLKRIGNDPLTCLRFSPDGQRIAGATEVKRRVCLWSAETGELLQSFTGHRDQIMDLDFHPKGNLLASCDRAGIVRIWNLDGEASRSTPLDWPAEFRAHEDRVLSLDFSPDGEQLITGSRDQTIKVWRRPKRDNRITLIPTAMREVPYKVAFTPSGAKLWVNGQEQLGKWNPETRERESIAKYPDISRCMVKVPGKPLAFCGYIHGALILWDIETGEKRSVVKGTGRREDGITDLSVSRNGSILVVARGNEDPVEFWDVSSSELTKPFQVLSGYQDGWVMPEGNAVILHRQNVLHEYDLKRNRFVREYLGHSNSVKTVTYSADGHLLISGSHDRTIRVWDRTTGNCLSSIPAHDFPVSSLAISPDGRTLASGDHRGHVSISHLSTGRMLFRKSLKAGEIYDLEFSPNGRSLAIVQETGVTLLQAPARPVHAD